MASSLTSVQKTMPCEYWKSTAAASSKPLTTTVDSSFVPPASTSRTSRRLAKSRKGDATEEKNKNVLALAASTDVQVPSYYYCRGRCIFPDRQGRQYRKRNTEVSCERKIHPVHNLLPLFVRQRSTRKDRGTSGPNSLSTIGPFTQLKGLDWGPSIA